MRLFDVRVTDDSVTVQPTAKPRNRVGSILWSFLITATGGYLLWQVLPSAKQAVSFTNSLDIPRLALILAVLFLGFSVLWTGFRSLFPSGESLECDRRTLTIGNIPKFELRGRWRYNQFDISEIRQVTFTTVRLSKYGGIAGLALKANNKKKNILVGLEAPEADQILRALAHLGVDTVHDPAMPMMIEIIESQRKGGTGLL